MRDLASTATAREQVPLVVLVPVGGGGMITGVAAALKGGTVTRPVVVVGCQPETNQCMAQSVAAGRLLPEGAYRDEATLSDGTAGGVEDGAITFEACRGAATTVEGLREAVERARAGSTGSSMVDAIVTVSEEEIARAVHFVLVNHHKVRNRPRFVAP